MKRRGIYGEKELICTNFGFIIKGIGYTLLPPFLQRAVRKRAAASPLPD